MKLWNKFIVLRRDGTVPDWPYLVIGARDWDDIRAQADDFERYRAERGDGDPEAPPHRQDDPEAVAPLKAGSVRIYSA